MSVEINLQNIHFPWNHATLDSFDVWWKGAIFIEDKLISPEDIRDFLASKKFDSKNDRSELEKFLNHLNGSFALIIQNSTCVYCIVDRVRSIPLFYSSLEPYFIISDEAKYLQERLHAHFNEKNGSEFLVTGYVTGADTLFDGVNQLKTGEYLIFNKSDGNYSVQRYFQYLHGNYWEHPEEELLKKLDDAMVSVFNRLISTTVKQGKTIVVPLSGGLDSRLIVAMLKRLGVDDVICYSYGAKYDRQVEIGRQVAKALGYTWYNIEYTKKGWYNCYHSDELQTYEKYAGNLTSKPYLQDYLAVKILKDEGKIPDSAVFVPGHSGDFLAGSFIPLDYNRLDNYSNENFLNETRKKHYILWKWNVKSKSTSFINQRIQKTINEILIFDMESYVNTVNFFVFTEKVAKFIVNSVRIFEFFGYEWRIPLWDIELMDFFLKIPMRFRINQNLYIKYAVEYVFIGNLKDLREIDCTKTLQKKGFIILMFQNLNKIPNYLYSFTLGLACTEKYPTVSRIRDKIFGHPYSQCIKYPIINEILEYSNKNKYKIPGNGLTAFAYLNKIRDYVK